MWISHFNFWHDSIGNASNFEKIFCDAIEHYTQIFFSYPIIYIFLLEKWMNILYLNNLYYLQ